jgi:thioredoxin 1
MNGVLAVQDRDFRGVVLGSAVPVVVGFCAGWSAASAPLGAVLDELAAAAEWLGVARLDVDVAPRTAAAYRVSAAPSVLVFSGGCLLLALPGVPTTTTIMRMLRAALPEDGAPTGAR